MRSCASRTPHEAELLFGLITQRRAGGQRAASTGAPRRNKAHGAVGTPRAAASSLVRCLSSDRPRTIRSEEHTSELQSLMRISYAVIRLKQKKKIIHNTSD